LLVVNALGVIGKTIRQEAALAYLGLSDPLAKSWGLMINRASGFSGIYFTDYWKWWLIPPVLSLLVTILLTRLLARTMETDRRETN
jgi:peptide/nickel transport system permease protein